MEYTERMEFSAEDRYSVFGPYGDKSIHGCWTPLHAAAADGDVGKARELLRDGAAVDAKGPRGQAPLHHAVLHGSPECV